MGGGDVRTYPLDRLVASLFEVSVLHGTCRVLIV